MSTNHESKISSPGLRRYAGMVLGLGVTATSMSSGFIWASQGKVLLVYVAGFFSWTGYSVAHYALTDTFVDDSSGSEEDDGESNSTDDSATPEPDQNEGSSLNLIGELWQRVRSHFPDQPTHIVGFVAGIAILVTGIALLAWYVRQENHLLGNLGSGMFLGGYVIAHYFDSGKFL